MLMLLRLYFATNRHAVKINNSSTRLESERHWSTQITVSLTWTRLSVVWKVAAARNCGAELSPIFHKRRSSVSCVKGALKGSTFPYYSGELKQHLSLLLVTAGKFNQRGTFQGKKIKNMMMNYLNYIISLPYLLTNTFHTLKLVCLNMKGELVI